MQHLIDLDTEYDMQEKEENEALDKENELILDIHKSEVSEGIAIKSVTTILAETGDIYAALTGDQCAITNIRIHS